MMKQKYLWMVRRAYRAMRHKKLRHRPWWRKLTRPMMQRELWQPCRDTVARGLAIGLFFSVLPVPQSPAAGLAAMWARANVPIAVAATWVSNPLTNVPLWAFQFWLGKILYSHFPGTTWVEIPSTATDPAVVVGKTGFGTNIIEFLLGASALGIILGLAAFPIVHLLSALMPKHLPKRVVRPARVRREAEFRTPVN